VSRVTVPGAWCVLGPSMTADAVRLNGITARDPGALSDLLERLPDPPWDVAVAPDDPVVPMLPGAGFETYSTCAVVARPLKGLTTPTPVAGVVVDRYRAAWSEAFPAAEAEALAESAIFAEMSQPTGYEDAAHLPSFHAAVSGPAMLGFIQTDLPDGWINWFGVVPGERRRGIGRALLHAAAEDCRAAGGTHLAALVDTEAGQGFFRRLGFTERGRRLLQIRRPA
jgi:ribosomal protein S18 acetylase RimI-like enzyme